MSKRTERKQGRKVPKCDQCEQLRINGVVCHEIGCPNMGRTYDPDREQWIKYVECWDCGFKVEVGEVCECRREE